MCFSKYWAYKWKNFLNLNKTKLAQELSQKKTNKKIKNQTKTRTISTLAACQLLEQHLKIAWN